ncbi:ABC transporter permease subunit [Lactococcus hircilactis]|uniref:ABC transporter permease subunit n=1 Tax=Lactococcus hircilactis TaxID=1494462 RepID=A0A7X1Z6R8_9LACT|nr:methionine ABC transporter permease [Lactococcus hircilactis]MQW38698.1 ABC transporter permease subunit [Lactococcus hircilactis]
MIAWFSHTFPNVVYLGWGGQTGWGTAIAQTLYMTFFSALIGGILGLIFGIGVVVTAKDGITPNRPLFWILDKVVSIGRAFPFIILLAAIAPFTQLLVHTQIGSTAALVPLSLGVAPFYARQVQASLESVDHGKIEAAQTVGADFIDIIFTVYLREELSNLIRVSTVTVISLIGLTAMAGAVGGGGLGNTAIAYGYNRFFNDVTWCATILILIFVLIVQFIGDFLAKKVSHK